MNNLFKTYLESLQPPSSNWTSILEKEAEQNGIPIMERDGIAFLKQIVKIKQPKKILEIGTAIGYSALQMQDACLSATIVTIERDSARYEQAKQHVGKFSKNKKIDLLYGDALECVSDIQKRGPYDLIFIDAAKGQNQRFFECFSEFVTSNGVIITDNVLFKGYVIDASDASKRMQALAKKIDRYNRWLSEHPHYETVIIPIGDGVAITTKRH
ncbi:O-methyltransferase [Amphibacillus cookii]|uniref:O-methyltransferase n=1 Tax=Amphibacillus cookii TaxID=767787 RepID=UPI0019599B6C|nr:O-methyltransferase [Amphibacillus cookii]MBM7541711.1 putative O-methyltransferase YrrM [Amphibacillus cookii]